MSHVTNDLLHFYIILKKRYNLSSTIPSAITLAEFANIIGIASRRQSGRRNHQNQITNFTLSQMKTKKKLNEERNIDFLLTILFLSLCALVFATTSSKPQQI